MRAITIRQVAFWALVAIVLALPWSITSRYALGVVNVSLVTLIIVLGLNVAKGYCGLISVGHAGFAAIGAYSAATKAGGDRQKTIENIRATQGYNGLSGEFSYDAKGRGRLETNIIRIGANKQVQVLETVKVKLSN